MSGLTTQSLLGAAAAFLGRTGRLTLCCCGRPTLTNDICFHGHDGISPMTSFTRVTYLIINIPARGLSR